MTSALNNVPALILVDVQQGFWDPFWGRSHNLEHALENMLRLAAIWLERKWPIVIVRHDSSMAESPLFAGTEGNRIVPSIAELESELIVSKTVNSSFLGTPRLEPWLRDRCISSIVVAGIQTNLCVETTSRMGGNLGFEVTVPLDATATFDLEGPDLGDGNILRLGAEELMKATAVNLHGDGFARVTSTDRVLQEVCGV